MPSAQGEGMRWWDRFRYARDVEIDSPPAKVALLILFARACVDCGFAFPGRDDLCRKTALKPRAVSLALKELRRLGLIQEHGYLGGGRGMTTQYWILPQLLRTTATPCDKCHANMKKSARGAQYWGEKSASSARYRDEPENRAPDARYRENRASDAPKPRTKRHQNRAPRAHQEVAIEVPMKEPSAQARSVDPSAMPRGAASPPVSIPTPMTPEQLTAERDRQLSAFAATYPDLTRPAVPNEQDEQR